ncbi:alginate O-acetyltransferase AlgX-related protein [Vibrio fluminensis]|uniref:alginate O-acetyltransferase AlgX-related protein n=1 Tax=Vibrio fluminensis TaxID=2783614 RepID=UPI001888A009|nr:hypothetical protein [Vibrio fluminensis]
MRTSSLLLFLLLASFQCIATPKYNAELVQELCSAAQYQENYNTQYTKYMYPLVLDTRAGIWMTGGQRELSQEIDQESVLEFKRFINSVEARFNATIVLALAPPRTLEHDRWSNGEYASKQELHKRYQSIIKLFRQSGIHAPDLSRGIDDVKPSYFFQRDVHWRPEGARHAAYAIKEYLQTSGILDQLPKSDIEFITKQVGESQLSKSTFNRVLKSVCGYSFIDESSIRYETASKAELDLFDTSEPDIYMLGTSYSKVPLFNFEGFLKEALQRDVTNLAVSGGGEYGAWLELLQANDESNSTHKIIIWELLSYYNPTDHETLKHLIPMVNDGCNKQQKLNSFSSTIHDRHKKELIFSPNLLNYYPSQLTVDLQTDVSDTKSLKLLIWHESGHKTKVYLSSTRNRHKNGRFVFELAQKQSDELGRILAVDLLDVESNSQPITQINGSVCLSTVGGNAS